MEGFLSTVSWVAPIIITILFSGIIPLFIHWHKISRAPIVKLFSHKPGQTDKDCTGTVRAAAEELPEGFLLDEKYSVWYRVNLQNLDGAPILVRSVKANRTVTRFKNFDYVMPGEAASILLYQDIKGKGQKRTVLDEFSVVIRNSLARFRVYIAVDNSDVFPKYSIKRIRYIPF